MNSAIRVAARYMEALQMPFPRDFYLPKDVRGTTPVNPEGTDLAIWTYESEGKFYGIAFAGKAQKPLWHHSFRSDASRQAYIDQTIASRKQRVERKLEVQQQRKEWQHNLQVGDILYSSWGYDQTNIDFYEVTAVSGKAVAIRKIEQKVVQSGRGSDSVVAVPHRFVGPPMKKIPSQGYKGDPSVKLNSHSWAYKWDGTPKHQTASGWGH